jgi:opacity protein-like surface antigen
MNRNRAVGMAAALVIWLAASTASADITGFLGLSGGPSVRSTWGLAAGISFLVVGVEFEYADITEAPEDGAPRIRTGSGNVLLQTPVAVGGVQLYGTAGAGGYHMTWIQGTAGLDLSHTNATVNVGGGAKIGILGPLRLRADYRYLRFMGAPVGHENIHRFYLGANLRF